jgi:hypothetical protein
MKRYTAIRVLTKALIENDIAIFIGEDICREAYPYHRKGNFYFTDLDYLLSFCVGVAMTTDKRIFVFCEDRYFVRNLSELMHAAFSRCKNLFLILLNNKVYPQTDSPIIFESINSKHGLLYNMGFVVHDYTKHFNLNNPIKEISLIFKNARGPMITLIKTDKGIKKLSNIEVDLKSNAKSLKTFILNKEIKSNNYVPPISLDSVGGNE